MYWAVGKGRPASLRPRERVLDRSDMRLVDDLYSYMWEGKGNNSHSYLFASVLRGEKPHVLVDPGHVDNEVGEHCFEGLVAAMARDGLKVEDVGLVINTHAHPDHCEASTAVVERTAGDGGTGRALVAIHEAEEAYRQKLGEMMARVLGRNVDFEPDLYLREGELNLGKEGRLSLRIMHTPGHSPGSISIYWPEGKVLISGDVVFYGGIGRTDIPGGDGKLLRQSIERLSELDIEYLLPGHSTEYGGILKGGDKVKQNFSFIRVNYFPLL